MMKRTSLSQSDLKSLMQAELLPPPSSRPIPLDLEIDPNLPEFVTQQKIEFLILMKSETDAAKPWGFPDKEVLQTMMAHIRDECNHDQVTEVALWS